MKHQQAQSVPADLQKVGLYMAKLRVHALPRNYQLFHEALFGSDRALGTDIAALGPNPSQPMLDEIGIKYHMSAHCGALVESAQTDAARTLREIAERLDEGLRKKQVFARTVETMTRSAAGDADQRSAVLNAEMDFLSASLANLLEYETELADKLKADVEKLQTMEKGAAAAQKAAITDRVTGLPNQIAFSSRAAALYDDAGTPRTALVLVNINDFRSFNVKFGQPASHHLLKSLGALLRKMTKKDDFVARLGADDFGLLLSDVDAEVTRTIAGRLRTSIEESLVYSSADRSEHGRITVCMGIALSDEAGSIGELFAQAQSALVAAQSDRRHPVQVFAPSGR